MVVWTGLWIGSRFVQEGMCGDYHNYHGADTVMCEPRYHAITNDNCATDVDAVGVKIRYV